MDFPTARELDDEDLRLLDAARTVIEANTDADSADADGIHTVGAAVMDAEGRVFPGVNLYHFTGGPCAELVALGSARAGGAREITRIAAVGCHGRGVLAPCGRDRQVLSDYHPAWRVIVPTEEGLRSVAVADLLPGSYRGPEAV
ncbi:cytidine deaminase family protein [Arthrobacter sp. UM1]|uniref:cytidine deaminase family protein n=1 Tax=Arthrobacter sp. UM1 TaxID=2766776 RepID=UPI001CF6C55E|nr:cytidine deaminase [Arthrobacter sp. UM1]MCB4208659.1 cytidine deaminase [Arthrobacter sp. UM1]